MNKIHELIDPLSRSIFDDKPDLRAMHRVLGYSGSFDEKAREISEQILTNFDDAVSQGDSVNAIRDMERMVGLLEGLLLKQEIDREVSEALLPTFALSQNDKSKVLALCAEMRKIILSTEAFDQAHKRRLLDRISGMEYQVEQPKGKLDVFLGGLNDFGEAAGKFGKDVKPLTDRMKDIMQITRRGAKEYDQIPAPEEVKQLPAPGNEPEE